MIYLHVWKSLVAKFYKDSFWTVFFLEDYFQEGFMYSPFRTISDGSQIKPGFFIFTSIFSVQNIK